MAAQPQGGTASPKPFTVHAIIDNLSDGDHVRSPVAVSGHVGERLIHLGSTVRVMIQVSGHDPAGQEVPVGSDDTWSASITIGFTGAATVTAQYVVDGTATGGPDTINVTIDS